MDANTRDTDTQPDYLSYLLRLWRVSDAGLAPGKTEGIWRASLENPHTGERKGFASLGELVDFLTEQIGGPGEARR